MNFESYILDNLPALLAIAAMWGSILWRVRFLEKKMDKHNGLIERMTALEVAFKDEKGVCERRFDVIEKALPRSARGEN